MKIIIIDVKMIDAKLVSPVCKKGSFFIARFRFCFAYCVSQR